MVEKEQTQSMWTLLQARKKTGARWLIVAVLIGSMSMVVVARSNELNSAVLARGGSAGITTESSRAWEHDPDNLDDFGPAKIRLVNGTEFEATISSIDQEGMIQGRSVPDRLNLSDVLSISTSRRITRDNSNAVSIYFVGGGQVFVSDPRTTDERISFRSASAIGELSLQAATAIVWSSSPMVKRVRETPSNENDTVVVTTSDGERRVEGILESIDSEFVRINYKGESRKIGLAKVKAIVMADLGLPQPDGSIARIQLVDQSVLAGVIEGVGDGQLNLSIASGTNVSVPTSNIAGIKIDSDRLLYLSDMDPTEVQEKAVFAIQRPWKRDRSVGNNPLRIRLKGSEETVSFAKGLGTQASSRLVFENTNQFDRFVSVVGIDAETGGRGDCQMIVRGDGIELWSKRIQGSGGPHEIDVDITGMKQVVLLVTSGEEFDLGDHADWGDARFLKTK